MDQPEGISGVFYMHRDDTPWNEAPLPPWRHKCWPQTVAGHFHLSNPGDLHADMAWCACGGWIPPGKRRYQLKNLRRKTRRNFSVPAAIISEAAAMWFLGPALWLYSPHWPSVVINVLAGLLQVWLFGRASMKAGGRSWDGETPAQADIPPGDPPGPPEGTQSH